jgi:hypothetical protein
MEAVQDKLTAAYCNVRWLLPQPADYGKMCNADYICGLDSHSNVDLPYQQCNADVWVAHFVGTLINIYEVTWTGCGSAPETPLPAPYLFCEILHEEATKKP